MEATTRAADWRQRSERLPWLDLVIAIATTGFSIWWCWFYLLEKLQPHSVWLADYRIALTHASQYHLAGPLMATAIITPFLSLPLAWMGWRHFAEVALQRLRSRRSVAKS